MVLKRPAPNCLNWEGSGMRCDVGVVSELCPFRLDVRRPLPQPHSETLLVGWHCRARWLAHTLRTKQKNDPFMVTAPIARRCCHEPASFLPAGASVMAPPEVQSTDPAAALQHLGRPRWQSGVPIESMATGFPRMRLNYGSVQHHCSPNCGRGLSRAAAIVLYPPE